MVEVNLLTGLVVVVVVVVGVNPVIDDDDAVVDDDDDGDDVNIVVDVEVVIGIVDGGVTISG